MWDRLTATDTGVFSLWHGTARGVFASYL
jgi:hypothetical protein